MQILKRFNNLFKKKNFSLSTLLPSTLFRNKEWNGNNLSAYKLCLYLNKALDKRGQKIGETQFIIKKGNEVVERHYLLDILNKPNKYMDGAIFWSTFQKIKDIYGEAYIYIESKQKDPFNKNSRKIDGLHLLNPSCMERKEKDDEIYYTYTKKDGGTVNYIESEILRIYNPDPSNPIKGLSILEAGAYNIATDIQLSQHQSNILKNGGKIEGVFKFKTESGLSKEQLAEIKEDYLKQYSKATKAGEPLFLGGDADYIRTSLTPIELSYLESKKMSLNDICIMTGVPKFLLSSVDDIKYDNAFASLSMFLSETILPEIKSLINSLNNKVFNENEVEKISFVDPVPENREEKRKDIETASNTYSITTNEKREMLGFDPIKDGDKILIPFSLTELGKEEPVIEEEKKEEKKIKKLTDFDHPFREASIRRVYSKMKIKKLDKNESVMKRMLKEYFDEQMDRVLDGLVENKAVIKKDFIDDKFNLGLEIKLASSLYIPIAEKLLLASGQDSLDFINYPFKFMLTGEVNSWIDQKANIFAKQINDTTLNKLKKEITESISLEEPRGLLVDRIKNTYGNITKKRATTIARTEVLGMTQKGTLEAYKQAQIPIKIWVAVIDGRTRDSHAILDGEEVPTNQTFSNGLNFPGDPAGSSAEIINCRCVI